MIKFEKTDVLGLEPAVRSVRNPWENSDSFVCDCDCPNCFNVADPTTCGNEGNFIIGPNDHDLMMRLAKGSQDHANYRRMIVVYVDITAPLYWWKEFDTYNVGTVANSCSTMHKIADKEFTLEDFSCEHLIEESMYALNTTIGVLNNYRECYIRKPHRKDYWWQMIQLLPSSYNQKRTIMMNYEVLAGIYSSRKDHKLDEWYTFCNWIDELPYSEFIIK